MVEVAAARGDVCRARKRFQGTRNATNREANRQVYVSLTNAFTIQDVNTAVLSMGKRKTLGLDRITASILSQALLILAPVITMLYNYCPLVDVFPSTWKVADVIAVPKGADKDKSDPK
ncbi:Hypothetical protein CINCED_3A024029 [Cinara cedri]|uniref:Uncharacterized protein n=1 Tax=Cinara cedri TaxID=506608 RepID=A0A5E4N5K9_9HEMI|nr:Hypothetical protein CINCED_3A024029 [Cinara cedri]